MRTDPKYYAKTPAELMGAAALMAKTIDGKLPSLFTRLPRLPYGVKPIPAEAAEGNTTAYYVAGSPDAGIAGTYFVNTTHLDQRPLWELPALTAHEAVPGHHMQIATQQELDLPTWRKYNAFFTAFVEGWGLYSERLGDRAGHLRHAREEHGPPVLRDVARLPAGGRHRHSRPGLDQGAGGRLHEGEYGADRREHRRRGQPLHLQPGQALAYKLGELKIRELRARAEKALGPKFDLRRFHDAVIDQGSMPLDALDAQINAWIASEKARN